MEAGRDARHQLRANLIHMEAAVMLVYDKLFSAKPLQKNTPRIRERLARVLAGVVPVYKYDEEKNDIQRLDYEDLRLGVFSEGSRQFHCRDGYLNA